MPRSKSSKRDKVPRKAMQDFISDMPDIITDKILKRLPFQTVVQMSVLSKHWRQKMLSHKCLVFDMAFYEYKSYNWEKWSKIISNMLLYHIGPIRSFDLHIPTLPDEVFPNISQWLSFLSRNNVKKISLVNYSGQDEYLPLPSQIYLCRELVKLKLDFFVLQSPTSGFEGFPNLRSLELVDVYVEPGIFNSLTTKCPCLTFLKLECWMGMRHIVIDIPSLESIVINGIFESVQISTGQNLVHVSLSWEEVGHNYSSTKTVGTIQSLADSCELQCLHFGGGLCRFLALSGILRALPFTFNHLDMLCLTELDFRNFDVFHFTIGMVQSCPCIKELEIEFSESWAETRAIWRHGPERSVSQRKFYCNADYKLCHLRKVKMMDITGLEEELKFIKYVLAISVVLERFYYNTSDKLNLYEELKVSRELTRFPRASTKAQLVYSEQLSVRK